MFFEKLFGITDYGNHQTMPAVSYYVMGDTLTSSDEWNRWAISDVWPIPYENQSLFFQPDGSLSLTPSVSAANISYLFNPMDLVPTRGGTNLNEHNCGPYDQNVVENGRTDVIQFDIPVSEPVLITGRIFAHLFVTSNCTDTDFTAKLMDVYPDGRSMLICDGIIRMRFRHGQQQEKLMDGTGKTVYEAFVDLWSTSYVFNAGHKIRVSISSSNYPRFDVNPNTGAPIEKVTEETPMVIAENTILISSNYASSIILPIPLEPPEFIDEGIQLKKDNSLLSLNDNIKEIAPHSFLELRITVFVKRISSPS